MTMAVRKTDEELTDKRKCKIGGLMTDLGLLVLVGIISFLHSLRVAAFFILFAALILICTDKCLPLLAYEERTWKVAYGYSQIHGDRYLIVICF